MYEKYVELRDKAKVSDYKVSEVTGITKSTFSDWKSGRSNPKGEKLRKIADYFGVSVEYLTTGEKTDETYYINEETAKVAQKIFENKELRMLFDAVSDSTPEDLSALHGMALALKRKERGYIDDTGC